VYKYICLRFQQTLRRCYMYKYKIEGNDKKKEEMMIVALRSMKNLNTAVVVGALSGVILIIITTTAQTANHEGLVNAFTTPNITPMQQHHSPRCNVHSNDCLTGISSLSFFKATTSLTRRRLGNTEEGSTTEQEGVVAPNPETTTTSTETQEEVVTAAPEDGNDDTTAVNEITNGDNAIPPPPPPHVDDPMIVAIKEEISKLETEIKSSRRQLADVQDQVEEYTKTGYARKVAEMENMRRARSVCSYVLYIVVVPSFCVLKFFIMTLFFTFILLFLLILFQFLKMDNCITMILNKMLQSSNKYTATAAILTEFLPAMDALYALKGRYATNEFGAMYNALPDAIRSGYTSMGCTEYTVEVNEPINCNRMIVIDTEPSTSVPNNCIVRTVVPGMELQGNTVRLAQVVVSSGSSHTDGTASAPPAPDGSSAA
jgi:molecular chaperone GrpE (heat shock protein)